MKTCIHCDNEKPQNAFYRHDRMADGRLNCCKECVKKRVRSHREQNIDKIRAYDRARGLNEDRKAGNRRRYRERISTPAGRKREWARAKTYQKSDKRACNIIVGNAIRRGQLVKQPCTRCGTTDHNHAHHEDYTQPMDVTWLCRSCHGERHREINELKRSQTV